MENIYWHASKSSSASTRGSDNDNFDAAASKDASGGTESKNFADDYAAQKKSSLESDKAAVPTADEGKSASSKMFDEVIADYAKSKRLCNTDWSEALKRLPRDK